MGRLRHLIVVLPGIGGSVLADPDGTSAWDLSARVVGSTVIDPERLDAARDLVPVRLIDSLTVLAPWLVVPGYDPLVHHLRTRFGHGIHVADYRGPGSLPPEVDVLRVPYDFRRSVTEAADVVGQAVTEAVGDSGRQVIVVAHSLGGLVARYWIGPCRGAEHCRALITLGTPHRGAPRALDWLVNGAGIGMLRSGPATRVLRGWPSVFELLPQYPAVLAGTRTLEPAQLSRDVVRPFGDPNAGEALLRCVARAATVHGDIAAAWDGLPERERPSVLPYFGRGHRTPNRAVLIDGRVRVEKQDPEWRHNVGWRGDGTVPAISCVPAEFSTRPELAQALPDKHGAMGSTAEILERLVTLQGDDLPVRGADQPATPWVGWDIEEVAVAHAPIDVGVELLSGAEVAADTGAGPVNVTVSGTSSGPMSMALGDDGWRATLPPMPGGAYEVTVEVKNAWYGTSVYATSPLAVLDVDATP